MMFLSTSFPSPRKKLLLTISTTLVDVRLHGLVAVLGTEVTLSELDVVLGDVHGSGELVGRHVEYVYCGWVVVVFKGREGLAYLKKRSLDCDWSVCKL
jgi:hypothetical protein